MESVNPAGVLDVVRQTGQRAVPYAGPMSSRQGTSPTRAKLGDAPTSSVPARSDIGDNTASELIEAPQRKRRDPLDPHDFADGGGSGGAERFSRARTKRRKA